MLAPRTETLSSSLTDGLRMPGGKEPFYLPITDEVEVFEECHHRGLGVMLKGPTGCGKTRFVEHMPTGLVLRYEDKAGLVAELLVTLDVYEMLQRLNNGYRPSIEEEQGYYLSLAVFKNLLGSAPYQEILLTTTCRDFYRIKRTSDSRLEMHYVREPETIDAS